jgi:tRNA 2-thiouridine synthesizing protein A
MSADVFDAGPMGCGELVLELRFRLAALPPGAELLLIATDPGAPEDIPSWCRMTGHALIAADPPRYHLQRRASP